MGDHGHPGQVPSRPLAPSLMCFIHPLPGECVWLHVDYARELEAALGGAVGEGCCGFEACLQISLL